MEEERWVKKYKVSIAVAVLFAVLFGIIYSLFDAGSLEIFFVSVFEGILFLLKNYYVYFLLFVAIVLIVFIYKKTKKYWEAFEFWEKLLGFFEDIRKQGEEGKRNLLGEKAWGGIQKKISGVFSGFLISVKEGSMKVRLFLSKNIDGVYGYIEGKRREWKVMRMRMRWARKLRVKERREDNRVRALELKKIEKIRRKEVLLKVKNRKIAREKFRKSVLGFFVGVKVRVSGVGVLLFSRVRAGKRVLGEKIGRYKKPTNVFLESEVPETLEPKSELTLDQEEFTNLIKFIQDHYEPFKAGVKAYIPLYSPFDDDSANQIKALFSLPEKQAPEEVNKEIPALFPCKMF